MGISDLGSEVDDIVTDEKQPETLEELQAAIEVAGSQTELDVFKNGP